MPARVLSEDIDVQALLDELTAWVLIESPTGEITAVNRVMDRAEAFARREGLDVERFAGRAGHGDVLRVGSPRATGQNEKPLLVLAHLDTVHALGVLAERLPLRRDGDRLYGPGIYDMKSGALMALVALKHAVAKGGPAAPVDILFVPDEETGSIHSRPLIEAHAAGAAAALVVEPARDGGKIVIARKGVAGFDIAVFGRASHAGTHPGLGRSAIREAARLVLALEALNDPARGITVTVGTIAGGTGRNTVPAECRLQVDVRLPDAGAEADILGAIRALSSSDPDIAIAISGGLNRPPFSQSRESLLLFERARTLAGELGFELVGMTTGGGSDGNFTAALGTPTLDGLGADGAGAHTYNEHILVSSIAPRTALLANMMLTAGATG